MSDPTELLQAIAAAGSRGRAAYDAAQASLAQQQSEALRSAIGGRGASITPESQAELGRIIGQGYAPRQAELAQNEAGATDYYNRLGANAAQFNSQAQVAGQLISEKALAAKMGGGGGGGSGGEKKPSALELRGMLEDEARASGSPDTPWWQTARDLARENGISSKDAISWFQPSPTYSDSVKQFSDLFSSKFPIRGPGRRPTPGQYKNSVDNADLDPGEKAYLIKQFNAQYAQTAPNVWARIQAGRPHPLKPAKKK